jgi:hypothetical protein
MDPLARFFTKFVIERLDKMEKIIEHPTPLQAGSLASFALYSPLPKIDPHIMGWSAAEF